HAVRDLVYDAIRRRRSYAWVGGADSGRGLMLGALRVAGRDVGEVFTGEGHAPAVVSGEVGRDLADAPDAVRLDCPDWLFPRIEPAVFARFQARACVYLRANLAKVTRSAALAALADEGIIGVAHDLAGTAIEVTVGARKIAASSAYLDGLVELQDAASQAVVEMLGVTPGLRVLDYCAGGGGKALALAALGAKVTAHDVNVGRMRDLGPRAKRAGTQVAQLERAPQGQWPLVLVDAPCSGTGTFARDPEAKWRLSPEALADVCALQGEIFNQAAKFVAEGGQIAWVTCSLLEAENADQVSRFLRENKGFVLVSQRQFSPLEGGDGFGCSLLRRKDSLI
ncbi:MAG: RsmB/NOP family class I SAM-dependent RNA methyltransferase, partial [Deltaproteobacteria bacterium]